MYLVNVNFGSFSPPYHVVFQPMKTAAFFCNTDFFFPHTSLHIDEDSPVLRLDPAGQPLPDVHGEVIVIQVIYLLQESDLQLLNLLPLAHDAVPSDTTRCTHPLSPKSALKT